MKRLNIVQILPELECGGVEQGTLEMGRYLVEHGHTSIVVSAGGRMVKQLEMEGSRHLQLQVGKKSPHCLKSLRPLRRLLGSGGIDILHLRSRLPAWIGFLALMGLSFPRRPTILTTFHGFYSVNGYSKIMLKGDCTIAVSEAIKTHIASEYGVENNIRLIHRGVDVDKFDPNAIPQRQIELLRQKWRLKEDLPVIMLPGRVSRLKGHHIFLKSLTQMKFRNFQAVIVGSYDEGGSYLQELNNILRNYGLVKHVHLVGHCDDMPAALALADIVINASSSKPEAFGRNIVEAMAMAKPVIATSHGGSLETVLNGETGWLIKPSSPEAMAKQLEFVLKDPQRLKIMGKKGREHVQNKFTTRTMCQATLDLYLEYLQKMNEDSRYPAGSQQLFR